MYMSYLCILLLMSVLKTHKSLCYYVIFIWYTKMYVSTINKALNLWCIGMYEPGVCAHSHSFRKYLISWIVSMEAKYITKDFDELLLNLLRNWNEFTWSCFLV
jgi:hypothetical protein